MSSDFTDITALVNLFQSQKREDHSSSEDEEEIQNNTHTAGASPAKTESGKKKVSPYTKLNPQEQKFSNFDEKEIEEFLGDNNAVKPPSNDWKKCPEWSVSYRQQVTPSDVFLQMGPKNPSTASCENMIVSIELPGDDRRNMDLKILRDRLTLDSPKHYLDIPLPHQVDPQLGNAQWDSSQEKLIVTLQMEREFDFMNF